MATGEGGRPGRERERARRDDGGRAPVEAHAAHPADKRAAIVDAARDLFTTTGYESTTIAQVAKRAGVAVGTVYLYFATKNDVLFAVKNDWEERFVRFLSQPELRAIPYERRARPIVEACFALLGRQREMVQLMGLPPQLVSGTRTGDHGRPIQAALASYFDEAVAAGAFRPVDTTAAAVIAYGMVHSALEQCFEVEDGQDQRRYIDALVDALEMWLRRPAHRRPHASVPLLPTEE